MSVPKLRFKEFDGDWSKYKIVDVTEYLVDGTHFSPKSTEGEFKYVTSKNIRNDGLDLSNISYISKEEHEAIYKRCKVKFGDILLTKDGANTGNCCLNTLDEEFSLLSSVAVLRGKKGNFDNKLLLQILQSDLGQNTIISSMSGQAITRITLAKLKDYSFNFPNFSEQTKIASFLSAVDEKISQLTQKHELLSQYKQGMMQKLFSQQIRFKADDGGEFGEWAVSNLGYTTEYFKGFAFKSESYQEDGVRIIRVSDLEQDSIKYNNEAIFLGSIEAQNYQNWLVKKNDIIVTTVGSKPHLIDSAVGRPIFIKKDNEGLLNQNLLILRPISENIDAYFIFSQLLDKKYLTHIETIQRGNANQSNITVKDLQEFELSVPCLEEQTKIANFLSAIDQKIDVVAQQIEQAKQWKKGLLQQMFV